MALAGIAFACTPIAGRMTVQKVVPGAGGVMVPTGSQSVTVGSRGVDPVTGDGMQFCQDAGSIQGGAEAAQGDKIRIIVEPWVCVNGGGVIDKAFNNLGTDLSAEVTWVHNVFDRSGSAYSYTRDATRDCHLLDAETTITAGSMSVVDGHGTADVTVPSTLSNSGLSDAAAVCVRSEDVLQGDPPLWGQLVISMAPLVVL